MNKSENYINELYTQTNKSKYAKWYISICERGLQNRNLKYTERHHIIPKFMNGNNSRKNLTELTGREHFIVHRLLTKMFSSKNLTIRATAGLGGFVSQNRNGLRKLNSRQISIARQAKSESQQGKVFTQEHKDKIRRSNQGLKRTPEQRLRNSQSHLGNKLSRESLDKGINTKKENMKLLKISDPAQWAKKRFDRISSTSKGHVIMGGVEYPSIGEAARAIGRNPDYVEGRVFSDLYTDWVFVPRDSSLKNV